LGWQPPDLDEFVEIPPGKFIGGDHQKEYEVKARYRIAKYPVTNAQFARFIRAGGYGTPEWWSKDGWDWRINQYETTATEAYEKRLLEQRPAVRRDRPFYWDRLEWNNPIAPVVGVSWFEAEAYCNWLTQEPSSLAIPQGYVVRLPSEDEWEKAARSTDGREYPWGDEFSFSRANVAQEIAQGHGPSAVCAYPLGASSTGVWDMSGNVWEWTASWYQQDKTRVLHGGAWSHDPSSARCAARLRNFPDLFDDNIGFRCVIARILEA
jgi:formylglycine-generating enzyme required for sulfatase activity